MQIFGWIYRTCYNAQTIVDYLPNIDSDDPDYDDYVYNIGPGDFLPNFVVYTNHIQTEKSTIPSEQFYWTPSDPRFWDVYFETYEYDAEGNQQT